MKKPILFFALALLPFFSSAQYTPLNLDTSSFWIQKYNDYHGAQPQINIRGEVLQYVEKDTTIMGQLYHKVRGYPTTNYSGSTNDIGALWAYTYYNPRIFIREDTLAKKIFRIYTFTPFVEDVLLDFDLLVGDSISYTPPDSPNLGNDPVDSIKVINYFGTNRRTFFSTRANNFNTDYERIEGVGATMSFPHVRRAEWGIAVYTLMAYMKNNTVQYKDSIYPIDSVYRKPAYRFWPMDVNDITKINYTFFFANDELIIQNPTNESLNIKILNLQGQAIFEIKSKENNIQHRIENVAAGIYILSVQSANGVLNEKIFVQ